MAISNASRLANFGTGIGTQGAALKIDNTNDRVGIGTTNPQQMLQVGTAVSVYGNSGIVSASKYYGDGSNITGIETGLSVNAAGGALQRVLVCNVTAGVANTAATTSSLYWNDNTSTLYATNVNVSGTTTTEDTQNVDSTGIVTAGLGFRATLGGIVVTAGVSTFSSALDINATVDIDGQTDLDELQVAGVSTFSAKAVFNTAYPSIDADNEIQVGTAIQLGKAGVVTATSFSGSGANLTDVVSGISLKADGSWVSSGTAATTFNFSGATVSNVDSGNGGYPGIATITIASAGISTAAPAQSSGIVTIDLSAAQDHKITASGVSTITCTSTSTEGESGTLRITNSGVSTVGFSTYFLWPSGSAPSIPIADGTISLISYTLHKNGSVGVGTQLLAGASLNFS